jgi:hypothetical protein
VVNGRGEGKRSFTLINRGGGSKKFLNLNTMSRILISIITNEDSENAISNDLATQNFPAQRHTWLHLVGVWPTKFNKLPTP